MRLYHYIHCPFCLRVRMACGLLNVKYNSIPLGYHDEKTPMDLCGEKMLPIMEFSSGDSMNESLDIIKRLDTENLLQNDLLDDPKRSIVEDFLSKVGSPVHSLCMPYWAWSKEFSEEARNYFQPKKEKKRGPFHLLIQDKETHLKKLAPLLDELEKEIDPFYKSSSLTILDIMIASHLWGMYVFPEFQFSPVIHSYLQEIKKLTKFDYHEDFWKEA